MFVLKYTQHDCLDFFSKFELNVVCVSIPDSIFYNAHIRAFSNKNFPLVLMSGARDKHESNRHSLSHKQLLTEEKCQRKITR